MQSLHDIDIADFILKNHSATVSGSAVSTNHQGVGAALLKHTEVVALKPDSVSSHMFTFRCAGARSRRIDWPSRLPGNVGRPGMSCFVPAGEQSQWECEGAHKLATIFLGVDFLAQMAGDLFQVSGDGPQFQPAAFHVDEEGAQLGRMVEKRLQNQEPMLALELDAWALLVGLHVLRRYSSVGKSGQRASGTLTRTELKTSIEFMRSNLGTTVRLADIAGSIGMSQFAFARAFRRSTGNTPHQFLTRLRVEIAQDLIAYGRSPLSDIAASVGFADQSHLTTQFRKVVGTTPARYRRARQG